MRRLVGPSLLCTLLFAAQPVLVPTHAWAADKKSDTKKSDDKKSDDKKSTDSTSTDTSTDKKSDDSSGDDVDLGENSKVNEDDFKEESGDEVPTKRLDEGDKDETDPDNLDFNEENGGAGLDFSDDTTQQSVKPKGPGEDTAQIYRDAEKKYAEMDPDEEVQKWEAYLAKYPNSLFKDRIEKRMDDLSNQLYGERVEGSDRGAKPMDAALRELNFALPERFASADPRTHLGAGFELGIPNWFGLRAEFEYQIQREWSAHAGIHRGLGGWEVAAGTRYAIIKSSRTGTILSGGLDLVLNTPAVFVGVQPTINFGQRINVLQGLDLQVEASPVLELRSPVSARYFFGFNGTLQANETVGVFLETSNNLKYLAADDVNPFTYMVGTFGLKFTPVKGKGDNKDGRAVIDLSASIPYSYSYWDFYQGALQVGVNYYF